MARVGRYLGQAFLLGVLAAAALGISASTAHAGYTAHWTYERSFTIDYKHYKNAAVVRVYDDGTGVNGGAKIHWAESYCISEAMMGVRGRLFNGSGVLLEAGAWVYNDPCDDTIYSNTDRRTGHGNYYGKGITHALYAPDYSTVYTYYNDPYIHYDP